MQTDTSSNQGEASSTGETGRGRDGTHEEHATEQESIRRESIRQESLKRVMAIQRAEQHIRFHEAIESGAFEEVQKWIECEMDPNMGDRYGRAPLHKAATCDSSDIVDLLLAHGADAIRADRYRSLLCRCTKALPVHRAAQWGPLDSVRVLAREGGVNQVDNAGRTPLHYAVSRAEADASAENTRSLEAVKVLVEAGAEIDRRYKGRTPLENAVCNGDDEVARFLIAAGGDVEQVRMERLIRREVPAHTIAAVIEAGMDPVKVDESGKSLLHVAVELGQVDLVNRLVSMGVDPQSVHTSESPATESSATDPADTGSPSLFWIRAGYSPEARSKLEAANANIRIGADERHELLFKAAQEGVEGMINLLLMRGADVNGRDEHGKSVLWKAVREGAGASVVETLLEAGATLGRDDEADGEIDSHRADDSNPSNNRYNVLSAAVWNGDVEVMQLLLQAGGQPNATGRSAVDGRSGRTPLHEAAEAGNIDMMRLLLQAGGRPDVAGRSGKTPLHDAAESGNIDMMRLLLQAGGRPDASTQSGRTPLHEAAEAGSVDAVRLLMDEGAGLNDSSDGRSPLHYAAESGSADLVQFLIEQGADPAKTDESGNTPLHLGAKHGPVVHALLKAGADVTSTNDRQNTPLHHAAPCAYYASDAAYPAMKRLIAAGADVNAANADGKTPLHRAVSFGAYQAMKHLIAAGADANAVDSDGETPLHKYLNMMHTGNDFVDVGTAMLLEAGADVNVTDTDGKTPLHLASDYGMASAVRLLLDAGADVSAVADYPESDLKGHTPLHRVADADAWYLIPDPYVLLRIAIDLIRAGADPAATTQDGTTPVELARQYDDEPMIQLLTDAGPESDIGVAP